MATSPEEWLKQAQYDLDTARYMFQGSRHFYAVFMCHLALEKALKGLYVKTLKETPPRVHNLVYLVDQTGMDPPQQIGKFMVKLSEAQVLTRYPESLAKLQEYYSRSLVEDIVDRTQEALEWIKNQY